MSVLLVAFCLQTGCVVERHYLPVSVGACWAGALWWLPTLVPAGAEIREWRCDDGQPA